MSPRRGNGSPSQPKCDLCHMPILLGVAHDCPLVPKKAPRPSWQWAIPILLIVVTQFIGAVWWASSLAGDVKAIRDNQTEQNKRLERIEQLYFNGARAPAGAP